MQTQAQKDDALIDALTMTPDVPRPTITIRRTTLREPVLATVQKGGWKMTVWGGLHYIKGNRAPYFSLTMGSWERGREDTFGAAHETILKHCPALADLAALHLSDIDGAPSYAQENGWYAIIGALPMLQSHVQYHAGNSKRHMPKPEGAPRRGAWDDTDYREPTPAECLQFFADSYIRTADALEQAQALAARIMEAHDAVQQYDRVYLGGGVKAAKAAFAEWVQSMRPTWRAQAIACIQRHGLQLYGDPWHTPSAFGVEVLEPARAAEV